MADLDAELLALAGEDSSDEETTKPTTAKASSPGSASESPSNHVGQSTVTPKKVKKPKAKKGGRRDESEEEGEASSGAGMNSAPMSESEGEIGSPGSDRSGPTFPIENKFLSEKDKAAVLAMPEIEREAILAERAAVLERKHQDNILKRYYEGQKDKQDDKSKRRKLASTNLEEGERKSSRQRTTLGGRKVGETSASLEAYKAQRERKGQLDEQRKAEAADRKKRRGSGSEQSDADADGESEIEWDNAKTKEDAKPRFDEPAELADYNRVLVGRTNFALVCYYPGFEDTIKDCYIRVAVGQDQATHETCYRMAKINGITEGKPYAIEGANGKPFVTSQYVLASVGNAKKEWPFIFCSMTRLSERELARYKSLVANDAQVLPKKSFLISKINHINRLVKHTFTEEELQKKLKRSGVLQQKQNAIERQTLIVQRHDAERNGDQEAVDEINEKIRALEGPKLAFGTSLYKTPAPAPQGKTQQERLGEINRANQKANSENVRKAEQAEIRLKRAHRAAVERGEAVANPFSRVKITPKTHFDVNNPQTAPRPKPVVKKESSQAPPSPSSTPNPSGPRPELSLLSKKYASYDVHLGGPQQPTFLRHNMYDEEIIGHMDLGITIDVFKKVAV